MLLCTLLDALSQNYRPRDSNALTAAISVTPSASDLARVAIRFQKIRGGSRIAEEGAGEHKAIEAAKQPRTLKYL